MDERIIEMLWQRNEIGIRQIEECYGRLFQSLANRILGSREEAEECVNDVLLDIWNTIPPQRPGSLSSYGCMLTRRQSIDRICYRTSKKRGGNVYDVALEELEECISAPEISEDRDEELREALNAFVETLSARERRLFIGRYFALEEMDVLAADQRMTKNAANIALSRIRKKLKLFLAERRFFV